MYIALDIGGTSTRIASSTNLLDLVEHVKIDTIHDLNKFKIVLDEHIKQLAKGNHIDAISAGLAGYLDKPRTRIIKAANFHSLESLPLADLFSQDYKDVPKFFENDACLAALGEANLGAGKTYNSVAYISLGTGVGGALIDDKKINSCNKTFEPGHMVVDINSTFSDGLGIKGSLETLASGSGFFKQFHKNPLSCHDPVVWEKFGYTLGAGILNVAVMWNPDVVVIGGGVGDRYSLFVQGIHRYLSEVKSYPLPQIVRSAFGEGSGVIGAFILTKQKLSI